LKVSLLIVENIAMEKVTKGFYSNCGMNGHSYTSETLHLF